MVAINATHDPKLKSWVASANAAGTDFPIQNLPHGVFSRGGDAPRGGVAIGDQILDMKAAVAAGLFSGAVADAAAAAAEPTLNRLMGMDAGAVSALRARLSDILKEGSADQAKAQGLLVPMADAKVHLPAQIRAFTDFMTSAYHISAARPGRPERPLQEVFKYLPIAYNSRASSVTESGRPVERPHGQYPTKDKGVVFSPSQALDFELEFAFFVGKGNALGQPVKLDDAEGHIFGYCLLNDWSARDIQRWESVLGPFQAKAFRSAISPWVVTAEAMAPFQVAAPVRAEGDPAPLPHFDSAKDRKSGGLNVKLDAYIRSAQMRSKGQAPHQITDTHFKYSYWTFGQMLVHHAINGCNLETGDLISSGTVSGPETANAACLAEITGGMVAIDLPSGETRMWLEDGDEVIFKGRAERDGYVSIGFGDCAGQIAPAVKY